MCENVTHSGDTFIREFDIDVMSQSLQLYQRLNGDVSCVVWDAAIVLAKYLEELHKKENNCLRKLEIIELGSGIGCVGLTAACLGANVLLTDLPEVLPLLQRNIQENNCIISSNQGSARAVVLAWGNKLTLEAKPNKILLADCIYYKESINALVCTLRNCAETYTEVLLSQEIRESECQRNNWQYFLNCIKEYFNIYQVPLKEQNRNFCSPDILLLKLTKK